MQKTLKITARWLEEDNVWLATSDDVPGLVVEAGNLDALVAECLALIPDLLELNQLTHEYAPDDGTVPVEIYSTQKVHLGCA